ncbi:hypothetical protein A9993_07705 [Rahnella victoriana]|uniref:hypothetical protein n=1 Tax=Rahnella victoriana TaxID=1510570 RepID=UPI000BB1936D|nr:hypothetical protein [Rahnella victoriana]PBI79629.1 hypothetical protein A9993_07705 [Rahnella victoriana]
MRLSTEHLKKMRERYLWNGVSEVTSVLDELIAIRERKGEHAPIAFTGSGSLAAIKGGHEGYIWGESSEAHPIKLYRHWEDA